MTCDFIRIVSLSTMNFYRRLFVFHIFIVLCNDVIALVRMTEPLPRSSLWRRGDPGAERNIYDGNLNCGGYEEQWLRQEGCCGICGDSCGSDKPNEHGGIYAKEIIAATYKQGDSIEVQITRNNVQTLGYFEFRICEAPAQFEVSQECLDKNLLPIIDSNNNTRFYPGTGGQTFRLRIVLPSDLFCTRCVLQFKYNTGYRLPVNACSCLGCGEQEQYYNCADISITRDPNYVPTPTSVFPTSSVSSTSASSSVTSTTPSPSIITIFPSPSVITVTQFESPTTCIAPTLVISSSVTTLSISASPTINTESLQTIFTRVTTEVVTTTVFQTPSNLDSVSKHCIESTNILPPVTTSLDLKPSSSSLKTSQDSSTPTPTSSDIDDIDTSMSSCICPSDIGTVTVSSVCPPASTVLKECSKTNYIQPSCPDVSSTAHQTSKPSHVTSSSSESQSKESNDLIWPRPYYPRKYHKKKENGMSPYTKFHVISLRQFKKLKYHVISGRSKYNQNEIIHSPSNGKPQATENTTSDRFFSKLLDMVKNLTPHNYTVFDKEVNKALKNECPTSTVFVTVTKHIQPSTTAVQQASSAINTINQGGQISPTPVITTSPPIQKQITTPKPTRCLPYSRNYRCFSVYTSVTDTWCNSNCPDRFCPHYLCLCACTELRALPTTPKPTKVCRSIRAGISDKYCADMCAGSYCPRGYCECFLNV